MTKILTPADRPPPALRTIAADLRATDRPAGERAILAHVAARLEDMAATKETEGRLLGDMLTDAQADVLFRADRAASDYGRKAFRGLP